MKISNNWLKEFVNFTHTPTELSDALTMLGIEVEAIHDEGKKFAGFFIGKVLTSVAHPNADKLSVCTVTLGTGEHDGSKPKSGDLDWNVPSNFDKAFSDAMVKLEKGKMTEAPVQSRFGFHVIQLDDVRSVSFPPLTQVRQQIQQRMVGQKVDALIRELRAKAKIE